MSWIEAEEKKNSCRRRSSCPAGWNRRVEHAHEAVGAHLVGQRLGMFAGIEGVEPDRVERAGRPQAQGVDPLAAPADHRRVDGGGFHFLVRMPFHAVAGADDFAAKTDMIGAFAPFEFPGVAVGQPGFRQFDLPAVVDPLAEHAVHVTDAVAVGGDVERGEAFHETGGQSAEAPVAERGVRFQFLQRGQVETVVAQGLFHLAGHFHVAERIAHQPADQEFEAEVIDPLVLFLICAAGRFHPAVDDPVAQGEDGGGEPVVRLGGPFVLADAVAQDVDQQGIGVLGVDAPGFGVVRGGDGFGRQGNRSIR